MNTGHQKQVWCIILAVPAFGAQHWLNAQWMKDPVAELGGGGFSWCWEERLHFEPLLTLVSSGQWHFPNCLAHSHCCFFKVRDLEAAGALITMSADTGVACIAQLLPGLLCKAFHLPEQCLSLRLLLLTLIVGHKLCKSLASQHPKEKSLEPLLHMGVSSALAVWQLIGLLKYVHGSIWDGLGRMFNSPVCSIVTVEKECEGVDVALHEMVQWAQGYFIWMILEVFCNPNDSVILFIWWAIIYSKQN